MNSNKCIYIFTNSLALASMQLITCLFVLLSFYACDSKVKQYREPDGSKAFPYQISSAQELRDYGRKIEQRVEGYFESEVYYELCSDIDLSVYSEGKGWDPISRFRGHFDGQGHTISGLTQRDSVPWLGLFSTTYDAHISNLYLEDVSIEWLPPRHERRLFIGALIGQARNTNITNVHVNTGSGTIRVGTRANNMLNLGGLVGEFMSTNDSLPSTISRCSFSGNIEIPSSKNRTLPKDLWLENFAMNGSSSIGGIVGDCTSGHILYCSNRGNIAAWGSNNIFHTSSTSAVRVGGIAGSVYRRGAVLYSYNMGHIWAYGGNSKNTASVFIGGIVGSGRKSPLVCCYNVGSILGIAGESVASLDTMYGCSASAFAGGIVGLCSSDVLSCYNMGLVWGSGGTAEAIFPTNHESNNYTTAISSVGGIVGYTYDNKGRVSRCLSFSSGLHSTKGNASGPRNLDSSAYLHRVIGKTESLQKRDTLYALATIPMQKDGSWHSAMDLGLQGLDGASVSAIELLKERFYSDSLGFDFKNTWKMGTNPLYPYPILQWQADDFHPFSD